VSEAKAQVTTKKRFSAVWIIPTVALLIGALMVVHDYQNRGTDITISFANADGITAEKTHIKMLNVDIGIVKGVTINANHSGVIVHAEINKDTAPLLVKDTQFWVVRPRIGTSGVSGLGTLLSGAYIEMSPGVSQKQAVKFIGLDDIPPTPANVEGLRLTLSSHLGNSLSVGEPVLYRGFKVGRVENTDLDIRTQQIFYSVFIKAPYDDLITSNTRFWNASGLSVKMNAKGVSVNATSLETMLVGGVEFGLPDNTKPGAAVKNGDSFLLFPDRDSINEKTYAYIAEYLLLFNTSIRGLQIGSPVTYNGIDVGKVTDISLDYIVDEPEYIGKSRTPIPVLISITPAALVGEDSISNVERMEKLIHTGISKGLCANLKTGNLLTGGRYIAIEYHKLDKAVDPDKTISGYPVIPTISSGLGEIQVKIVSFLDKLNSLPLKRTVNSADVAIHNIGAAAKRADSALVQLDKLLASDSTQAMPQELENTLRQLRATVQDFSSQSALYRHMDQNLQQLKQTLSSVEQFTNQLGTRPSSIVFSDPQPADTQPEAAK